jgi:hypothetical protein
MHKGLEAGRQSIIVFRAAVIWDNIEIIDLTSGHASHNGICILERFPADNGKFAKEVLMTQKATKSLEADCSMEDVGQPKTLAEAFLETLG